MTTNWPELTEEHSSDLKTLRGGAPTAMKAFSAIAQAALAPKALDLKTKELLALGISVAVRCDEENWLIARRSPFGGVTDGRRNGAIANVGR